MKTVRFPNEVADRITADTWTTGWGDRQEKTCLHGHIRQCDLRPGDEHLIATVFSTGPGSMSWNDKQKSHVPVAEWAREAEITDGMLAETFGPQWLNVVGLIRRLAVMTGRESVLLEVAWNAARYEASYAAGTAVTDVAWDAARAAVLPVAWGVVATARPAARDAAQALVVADLIGQYGLEEHHVEALLAPVRQVLGDPLDPEIVQEWLQIGEQA